MSLGLQNAPLPTLDAHCHLGPDRPPDEFGSCGVAFAMTFGLLGATTALERRDLAIAWGTGCHPRSMAGQTQFEPPRFEAMIERTAVVGEIGLDARSRVSRDLQLRNLRLILDAVADLPRIASIHSVHSTRAVLDELRRRPIVAPILHGWTGDAGETVEAVRLGCYFSIPASMARQARFRTRVPLERVLVESDQGCADPPAAIPCRIELAEHLLAQQYRVDAGEIRAAAWSNLTRLIASTETWSLLPPAVTSIAHPDPAVA